MHQSAEKLGLLALNLNVTYTSKANLLMPKEENDYSPTSGTVKS